MTLRRVTIGIAKPADRLGMFERLKPLLLAEEIGGGLRLSPVGRARYLALPNSAGTFKPGTPVVSKMAGLSRKVGDSQAKVKA
jgi:hypothetical protein